jgi:hypothetical protein
MAGAGLTAMGIESFFVCSLLIWLGLGKSEKSENRSKKRYLAAKREKPSTRSVRRASGYVLTAYTEVISEISASA